MPSIDGIAQAASAIQASQTQSQVQVAVARKVQEAAQQQGSAAVQLLQNVANSNNQLDVRA